MRAKSFCVLTTRESRVKNCTSKMHLTPQWPMLLLVLRQWFCCCWSVVWCGFGGSVRVYWLWGVLCLSLFCCALLCVLSSFAIILERKRELVALLLLS